MKKLDVLALGLSLGIVTFIMFVFLSFSNAIAGGYVKEIKAWGLILTSALVLAALSFFMGVLIALFYNLFVSRKEKKINKE